MEAMTIQLEHYLILGAIVFSLGVAGIFLNRKNAIILLMSLELILLAANINFITRRSRTRPRPGC